MIKVDIFRSSGYFSVTSGNITDEMINDYINNQTEWHELSDAENISVE
jgi:putative transposase